MKQKNNCVKYKYVNTLDINITYTGREDEYPEEYTLTIQSGSMECNFNFRSYGNCEPFFVKNTDGSCYLYLFTSHENDYSVLLIYKITNSDVTPASLDNFAPFCWNRIMKSWKPIWRTPIVRLTEQLNYTLTNPEHMMLSSRLSTLSTCFGCKDYHANVAGVPQSEQDFLIIRSSALSVKTGF